MQIFESELDLGLSGNQADRNKSSLLQVITFVTRLPDGSESGDFLSIDLGSTNFRVLLSRLHGSSHQKDEFAVKYYDVPDEFRTGHSQGLFDFMASSIADFIQSKMSGQTAGHKKIPIGFSFSYPVTQTAIDESFLVTWTKSYDLPDAIGKNAVQLLRDSIRKTGDLENQVEVVAILNDSTGTLVKGSYLDPDCCIGMILGSGFNICYIERIERIKKLNEKQIKILQGSYYYLTILTIEN